LSVKMWSHSLPEIQFIDYAKIRPPATHVECGDSTIIGTSSVCLALTSGRLPVYRSRT
jgi:hypothetical protein